MMCASDTVGPALAAAPLFGTFMAVAGGVGTWAVLRLRRSPLLSATRPAFISETDAVTIVRERYVRGEIDLDTFEEMLARLVHSGHPLP